MIHIVKVQKSVQRYIPTVKIGLAFWLQMDNNGEDGRIKWSHKSTTRTPLKLGEGTENLPQVKGTPSFFGLPFIRLKSIFE